MKRTGLMAVGILLIVLGPLVVLMGVAYTLMLPEQYEASTRMSVDENRSGVDGCFVLDPPYTIHDPGYVEAQLAYLKSKVILNEVASRFDLAGEWGNEGETLSRDETYRILADSICVFQEVETSLFVIYVRRPDPEEAAKIANEIAAVYGKYSLAPKIWETRKGIGQISDALKRQRTRVDKAEHHVEQLWKELDLFLYDAKGASDARNIRVQEFENRRLAAQLEMTEKEAQLKILADSDDKELIERASHITFDPMVMDAIRQIQNIEIQLVSLADDFGPNHPEIQRCRLQKETLEKVLERRLVALKNGLATEYMLAKQMFDVTDKELVDRRQQVLKSSNEKFKPFQRAQTDLESERFIYDQLNAKLRERIIMLEVPRNTVEIIDAAEPNMRPVSPNLFMNVLLLIGVAVVPMFVGIVLIVVAAKQPSPPRFDGTT